MPLTKTRRTTRPKKRPRRFLLLNSGVYSVDILFSIGTTEAQVRAELARRLRRTLTAEESSSLSFRGTGRSVQLENGACVMWLRNPSASLLSHEVFHTATFILTRAGIPLTDSSDEAYAYLIEHLTRQALALFP